MGSPPRPSTMKLLMLPVKRTPQSGRNCDSASSKLPGNADQAAAQVHFRRGHTHRSRQAKRRGGINELED